MNQDWRQQGEILQTCRNLNSPSKKLIFQFPAQVKLDGGDDFLLPCIYMHGCAMCVSCGLWERLLIHKGNKLSTCNLMSQVINVRFRSNHYETHPCAPILVHLSAAENPSC